MTSVLAPGPLLAHVSAETPPLRVPRGRALVWADERIHAATYASDPELYALAALIEDASVEQRARVLLQLLRASRRGLSPEARTTVERVTGALLDAVPHEDVLTVFLALRRARANHKHVRAAALRYLFDHPDAEAMAVRRGAAMVDALEHALGRDVARGCARALGTAGAQPDGYLRANLLKFVRDPARALRVLGLLYGKKPARPRKKGPPKLAARHVGWVAAVDPKPDAPRTVTTTNRGDIAATLVHIYRGGESAELRAALERYADRAAEAMPRFAGRITFVLDASASTAGYGERALSCISQSVALRMVFERVCPALRVIQVGGRGDPPAPEGASDLASALLDALEDDEPRAPPRGGPYRAAAEAPGPDVVAIVTDGYENRFGGDLGRVLASLPGQGAAPVVVCTCKFTAKDDLSLRKLGSAEAEIEFWHEDDFPRVLVALGAHARRAASVPFLREVLTRRLARIEQELTPWIAP